MLLRILFGLLVGQTPLPSGHPDLPPTAHAIPPEPDKGSFQMPANHPGTRAPDGGESAPSAEDAKRLLEQLDAMKAELKNRPKTAEIEYALANLYYENGRYPDAIDSYRQLIERTQAPMQRYFDVREKPHKPISADKAGCPASARPTYDELIVIADRKAEAKDWSAAVVCYEAALLPVVTAHARRGNAFFLLGNEDNAIREHEEALRIVPTYPDSLFFLGAVLFEGGEGNVQRLKQAKEYWRWFLLADPDPEREKLVRTDLTRLQAAIDNRGHIEKSRPSGMGNPMGPIEAPPPPPNLDAAQRRELRALVAKGQQQLKSREWSLALKSFSQAREYDAADPEAATGAGVALMNLGQRVDAEAALRDALGRDPKNSLALYQLGELFFENEHYVGAARFWLQVLEEDPALGERMKLKSRIADAQNRQ
jgi:tetratricopeptide (TPR) repeat protein